MVVAVQDFPLRINNVNVAYDGKDPVIRGISLDIKAGETFGLVGLNGAGKTTLIKSILGLRRCQSGSIRVFDKAGADSQGKSQLAYLPERFDPPWFLSGLEFLEFSLRLYGLSATRDEIFEHAERVALDPAALRRRVQTYSKGMRQKLGLLGTIMTRCRLLILDEPMSGLDPQARSLVKDLLKQGRAQGQTLFLSSHILADMEELCDRIAVLHDGGIRFTGSPRELMEKTGAASLERAFLHFIEKRKAA
jgi:ABC-2 type transport system ATP-binding protein